MEKEKKKSKLKIIIPIIIILVIAVVGIIFLRNNNSDTTTNEVYIGNSTTPILKKDIIQAYNDNQAKFDDEYKYKQVRFTGTISNISTYTGIDKIKFKEGWELEIPNDFCKKLSELKKGDKLEVTSKIQSIFANTITIYNYGYNYLADGRKVYRNFTSMKLNGEEICIISE